MEQRSLTAVDLAALLGMNQRRVLTMLRGERAWLPPIRPSPNARVAPPIC